ncbi:hypothetical protein [Acidiferrobacter sp.]|uniref:hypothetical protein n=1 Tax=Acidiferrobacter sp. TaxID=1872107 RepID=UPI002614D8E1|nr:hypothetical protein [Acidiferrobacter sp.]
MNGKWLMAAVCVALAQGASASGLTDPTRPPWIDAAAAGATRAPGLQAIMLDGARRFALINGRLVTVGGRVGAARLIAIHHDSVVLSGREGTRRLMLGPGRSVKKTAVLKEGVS